MTSPTLIIDFDSTFVQVESLEVLASISLKSFPEASRRINEIERLTRLGMEGKLSYPDILADRVALLCADRGHVDALIAVLHEKITPSFLEYQATLQAWADRIYIVSGGFLEFICPIIERFGLRTDQVFANRFLYDYHGNIMGVDPSLPLSRDCGKVEQIRLLNLQGPVVVIGDGMTDYAPRREGVADQFIAFTENVHRAPVVEVADFLAPTLGVALEPFGLLSPRAKVIRPQALLLESIHPEAAQGLKTAGMDVQSHAASLATGDLASQITDVRFLGIRSKTRVDEALLAAAPKLEAIGAFCIGTNQIDIEACARRGIAVFNAPFSNTRSVVELAIGEMIMLQRRIWPKSQKAHAGVWDKSLGESVELRGKNLGIVGYGCIGSQLSILAEALGMHVYFYDVSESMPLGNARSCASLEALLGVADVISVHVDGRGENQHLIGREEFAWMRKGVIFLNLSRGSVVDLDALKTALETGRVGGASVDVYPQEPKANGDALETPLQGMENVILTPHIGGNTKEAQHHIGLCVSGKFLEYWKQGSALGCLSLPPLSLPPLTARYRILHIHENIPGILAQVTQVFADHDVNIEAQYLKTQEHVGYLAIDIDSPLADGLIGALEGIQHTKRVRVIGG